MVPLVWKSVIDPRNSVLVPTLKSLVLLSFTKSLIFAINSLYACSPNVRAQKIQEIELFLRYLKGI